MNNHGYDRNGVPIDYIDENGVHWVYDKKQYGADHWRGYTEER